MLKPASYDGLSKKVLRGIKWSYFSAAINAVLHLLVICILARLLEPADFGLMGIALIFISFAERIGQVGVGPAIVQKQDITDHQLQIAGTLGIISGLLIFFIFWIISPIIAGFFSEPVLTPMLRILGAGFILEGICMVPDSCLQRQLKFDLLLIVENLSYLIGSTLIATYLAWIGYGVWSLVWGFLLTRLTKAVILQFFVPQSFLTVFSFKEAASLLRFGAGFSLGRILNFSALYGDNFIVGRVLGPELLGVYSRAYQLMTLSSTYFAQIIDKVLFPALSKKQDDKNQLQKAYFLSLEAVGLVSLPLSIFMFTASGPIVLVLMGHQWNEMIPVLAVLSLGIFFRTAYKSGDTLARSQGAVYQHAWRQLIYALFVIIGSFIGARFGLIGVAYAVLAAVMVNYIAMSILSINLLRASWLQFAKAHVPGIWWSICVFTVVSALKYLIPVQSEIVQLVIMSLAAVFGVCLAIIITPKICRSSSLSWLAFHADFKKYGIIGRGLDYFCRDRTEKLILSKASSI